MSRVLRCAVTSVCVARLTGHLSADTSRSGESASQVPSTHSLAVLLLLQSFLKDHMALLSSVISRTSSSCGLGVCLSCPLISLALAQAGVYSTSMLVAAALCPLLLSREAACGVFST